MLRLAINGYGRIGRSILRALYESPLRQHMEIVAINELADAGTVLHLTRYDSTHGRFSLPLEGDGKQLRVDGDAITLLSHTWIDALPWQDLGVDIVLECTGAFSDRATAEQHLRQGAGKVLFSQPAQADVDKTVVYGVNHRELRAAHRIVSNASCSTNGHLNFNEDLLVLEQDLSDYVIVHELLHFFVPNHALVAKFGIDFSQ